MVEQALLEEIYDNEQKSGQLKLDVHEALLKLLSYFNIGKDDIKVTFMDKHIKVSFLNSKIRISNISLNDKCELKVSINTTVLKYENNALLMINFITNVLFTDKYDSYISALSNEYKQSVVNYMEKFPKCVDRINQLKFKYEQLINDVDTSNKNAEKDQVMNSVIDGSVWYTQKRSTIDIFVNRGNFIPHGKIQIIKRTKVTVTFTLYDGIVDKNNKFIYKQKDTRRVKLDKVFDILKDYTTFENPQIAKKIKSTDGGYVS